MRRDARAYLWHVRDAADAINTFLQNRTFDDYLSDRMLRSAVEREFANIGEALNQLRRLDLALATRIPELGNVIGFRNVLIHGYDDIDNEGVWRIVHSDLRPLRDHVDSLLAELGPEP